MITSKNIQLFNVEPPHHCSTKFGFGYDECIDDYKVVGFFIDNRTGGSVPKVKVYTLRSNSWRRIGDCPYGFPPNALRTVVNRALHWILWCESSESNGIIVSLDLVNETYGEVSKPDYRDVYFSDSLGVLSGCLCILGNHYVHFDLWVMKEYGIRDSWTKLVVVPYLSHPSAHRYSAVLVCILENGEVLLDTATHLVRYNLKNGTFSYPVIQNCSPDFSVCLFIESLVVSLESDANSGVQWQHQY